MPRVLLVSFSALFLLIACQSKKTSAEDQKTAEQSSFVSYTLLAQGIQSGIHTSGDLIIDSKAKLDSIWKLHYSYLSMTPEPPDINFQEEIVLAVFMGDKPTTGFYVRLDSVYATKDEQIVAITANEKPDSGKVILPMVNQPFFFVATEKTGKDLRFEFSVK